MDANKILFSGELQLTAWGESSTTGAWVKFWIHPEDLEAFKLLRTRVGKVAGQRIGAALVEIADDEAVVSHAPAPSPAPAPMQPPQPRGYRAPHITGLAMLAVRWCTNPMFQRWGAERMAKIKGISYEEAIEYWDEAGCKGFILAECGITSRKFLAEDGEPARIFNEKIRLPFMAWSNQQGETK